MDIPPGSAVRHRLGGFLRRGVGVTLLLLGSVIGVGLWQTTAVSAQSPAPTTPLVFNNVTVATGALPDTMHKQLAFAHQVGMPFLIGTDGGDDPQRIEGMPPGFALHAELAVFVTEGLTPLEGLQAVTINPARALRVSDSLGTVTAGKLADLILLDADPLMDIGNTTAIQAVVANGRYYDRAALDKILADVQRLPKPMYPTKSAS